MAGGDTYCTISRSGQQLYQPCVLWPYTVQAVVERHNRLSLDKDGKRPFEKFSGIRDEITPTYYYTQGCTVFILEAANQSGGTGTLNWKPRSHTGI